MNSNMFSGCDLYSWRLERHEWRIEWVSKNHFVALSRTDHLMGDASQYLWRVHGHLGMRTRTIYEQDYKKAPK